MHIINLSIKCKEATGDGTKIVCLNTDYKVRITAEDCGTFTDAPVKKLIVRHGREYFEAPIKQVISDGKPYLQANLPPIEWKDYVYLGVCGKNSEDSDPSYTSTSAKFDCDNSILNGAIIRRAAPTLIALDTTVNGTYSAVDSGADGFHTVTVNVPISPSEVRTLNLNMLYGDQEITPTYTGYLMSKVTIKKPDSLTPDNIKNGVSIGGIVGTYDIPYYDGAVSIVNENEASVTL